MPLVYFCLWWIHTHTNTYLHDSDFKKPGARQWRAPGLKTFFQVIFLRFSIASTGFVVLACIFLSLLNNRNRSEIAHIFEISHFKKQPYSRFYPKNHLESINVAIMIARLSKTKQKVE